MIIKIDKMIKAEICTFHLLIDITLINSFLIYTSGAALRGAIANNFLKVIINKIMCDIVQQKDSIDFWDFQFVSFHFVPGTFRLSINH